MAITLTRQHVSTLGGYSICHHGNNICQYRLQPTDVVYPLPHITMAITSATLFNNITYYLHCGYTTNHINMTITSATVYGNNICHSIHGNNTCQGNPYALMNIWLNIYHIIQLNLLYVQKITGHTNTHTPSSVEIIFRITFSSDQKKPCLRTGKSLSSNKINVLFMRKLLHLQNLTVLL